MIEVYYQYLKELHLYDTSRRVATKIWSGGDGLGRKGFKIFLGFLVRFWAKPKMNARKVYEMHRKLNWEALQFQCEELILS